MVQKRLRDSRKSKQDILAAAEMEFSEKGIYGTRVDEIASKANINKRMIYEYFGSKEELYKAVLSEVYSRLAKLEIGLLSGDMPCTEAIERIISLYFYFLRDNPSYVNLILWENLNRGKYIEEMDFSHIKHPALELLRKVIERGKREGVFQQKADTEQVILSLLTYTFSYYSNRYTLSKMLGRKLEDEQNIRDRIKNVTEMFLCYLCNETTNASEKGRAANQTEE